MLAYQFTTWEEDFELRRVPTPRPGPGETLIRVAGAGVCHSDLYLCDWPRSSLPSYELPFTVGHEITGWVESSGPGSANLKVGTPVAVYGAWGCGACRQCAAQAENYCENAAEVVASGPGRPGLGRDGGIAEFFLAPQSRHLVALPDDLDPPEAAPLTDAGLTTYHAVKQSLGRLHPGSTAVVIGIGGLGSLAVQILRVLSAAQVIAVDIAPARLEVAAPPRRPSRRVGHGGRLGRHSGAHGRPGCGVDPGYCGNRRHPDAGRLRRGDPRAHHGGGNRAGIIPHGLCPRSQRNLGLHRILGTISDLAEVVALAGTGAIKSDIEKFPMQQAPLAYRKLREGSLEGRAVIVPHGPA